MVTIEDITFSMTVKLPVQKEYFANEAFPEVDFWVLHDKMVKLGLIVPNDRICGIQQGLAFLDKRGVNGIPNTERVVVYNWD